MITKDYQPSMKPVLRDGKRYKRVAGKLVQVQGDARPTIEVSKEYFDSLKPFSRVDKGILDAHVAGASICPMLYWFHDTPETRRILRAEE